MTTNKILAVGSDSIIELEFKKVLTFPKDVWLRLCQKQYPDYGISEVFDGHTHHICKYCGGIAKGIDSDILCEECRDDFGHSFYSEL